VIYTIYLVYAYYILCTLTSRRERDRESGFRGCRDRARHDVSISTYLPTGKTVANHDSFCASKTAAEARRRTMRCARTPQEVHFLCRRRRCRRRHHAGDWPTRRAAVLPLSLLLLFRIPSLFYSNNTMHKRTLPYIICFLNVFASFFLSLTHSRSFSPRVPFMVFIYIYCLWLLLARTYRPILVS